MSTPMSTHGRNADTSFAPHPLNEVDTTRAARFAEEAQSVSSAILSTLTEIVLMACELIALGAFGVAVVCWTIAFTDR